MNIVIVNVMCEFLLFLFFGDFEINDLIESLEFNVKIGIIGDTWFSSQNCVSQFRRFSAEGLRAYIHSESTLRHRPPQPPSTALEITFGAIALKLN